MTFDPNNISSNPLFLQGLRNAQKKYEQRKARSNGRNTKQESEPSKKSDLIKKRIELEEKSRKLMEKAKSYKPVTKYAGSKSLKHIVDEGTFSLTKRIVTQKDAYKERTIWKKARALGKDIREMDDSLDRLSDQELNDLSNEYNDQMGKKMLEVEQWQGVLDIHKDNELTKPLKEKLEIAQKELKSLQDGLTATQRAIERNSLLGKRKAQLEKMLSLGADKIESYQKEKLSCELTSVNLAISKRRNHVKATKVFEPPYVDPVERFILGEYPDVETFKPQTKTRSVLSGLTFGKVDDYFTKKDQKAYEKQLIALRTNHYETAANKLQAFKRSYQSKSLLHWCSYGPSDVNSLSVGIRTASSTSSAAGKVTHKVLGFFDTVGSMIDPVVGHLGAITQVITVGTHFLQAGTEVIEGMEQKEKYKNAKRLQKEYINKNPLISSIAKSIKRAQDYKQSYIGAGYHGIKAGVAVAAIAGGVTIFALSVAGIATGYGAPIVAAGMAVLSVGITGAYASYKAGRAARQEYEAHQWDRSYKLINQYIELKDYEKAFSERLSNNNDILLDMNYFHKDDKYLEKLRSTNIYKRYMGDDKPEINSVRDKQALLQTRIDLLEKRMGLASDFGTMEIKAINLESRYKRVERDWDKAARLVTDYRKLEKTIESLMQNDTQVLDKLPENMLGQMRSFDQEKDYQYMNQAITKIVNKSDGDKEKELLKNQQIIKFIAICLKEQEKCKQSLENSEMGLYILQKNNGQTIEMPKVEDKYKAIRDVIGRHRIHKDPFLAMKEVYKGIMNDDSKKQEEMIEYLNKSGVSATKIEEIKNCPNSRLAIQLLEKYLLK